MTRLTGRSISIGGLNATFTTNRPDLAARWDELFAPFPDALPAADVISISTTASGGTLSSSINDEPLLEHADPSQHELAITRALNHLKLDAEGDRIHFHSAAVARDGRAVLLLGRSGDGKSTLTATLVRAGWEYVTDEQVTFDPNGERILPYPRPLTLRQGVWHLFPGVTAERGPHDYHRVEMSLRELGGHAAASPVVPTATIAPQYRAGSPLEVTPFSDTGGVIEFLASCCHDLGCTGERGVSVLVRLAASCAAWRLHYDDVEHAAHAVSNCLDIATRRPLRPFRRVETDRREGAPGTLQRARQTVAWTFEDGSGIVLAADRPALLRLDRLGSALWDVLATPTAASVLIADSPDRFTEVAIEQWLESALAAGFIERAGRRSARLGG